MGQQILRQPDGRFAVFSSITDTIVLYDATADEVVEWFADIAADVARRNMQRIVDLVEAGQSRSAYHQFALSWDEALTLDREHDGDAWQAFTCEACGAPATVRSAGGSLCARCGAQFREWLEAKRLAATGSQQ